MPTPMELAAALGAGTPDAKIQAAEQLATLGEAAAPAAASLVAACVDERLRPTAVGALEGIGPPPDEQLDRLASLVADADETVGYWAATLLGRAGPAAAGHASTLAAVGSKNATAVAERAVWALGKIGPPASAALPTLRALADTGSSRLARLAEEAIEAIAG